MTFSRTRTKKPIYVALFAILLIFAAAGVWVYQETNDIITGIGGFVQKPNSTQ